MYNNYSAKTGKDEVMYCTRCGNKISDDAKFCTKCGQPFEQNTPMNTSVKTHKKINKASLVRRGVIVFILLLIVIVRSNNKNINNNNSSTETDEPPVFAGRDGADRVYENGFLNFGAIIGQCADCEAALGTLADLNTLMDAYGYDEDELNRNSLKKYNEMQHNCTAEVVQVEGIPYVYRGCYGTYSGSWRGAGPSGTGTFEGRTFSGSKLRCYTGDWEYGLPEGTGELYIQKGWGDMTYFGQMSAGLREGTGCMYDRVMEVGEYDRYGIYNETTYQNDAIAEETLKTVYDCDTNEVRYYVRVMGGEDGEIPYDTTQQWHPGELSPETRQTLETAGGVALVGILGYMAYSIVTDPVREEYTQALYEQRNQEMFANLARQREQERADYIENQERQKKEAEEISWWYQKKYEEALNYDPEEQRYQTKDYKYNANYYKYNTD